MTRGAFITVEGGEGVGKSTCLKTIEALLSKAGKEVVVTREPGGTPLGERVREWILHGEHGALSAEVEALLMFAARAEHLDKLIRPALDSGHWVLCDRFTDATLAYQGGGRGASVDGLRQLARFAQGSLQPDLTLLLDAPVDVGLSRIQDRSHDHFERESREFFERVRRTYLELARQEPGRITVIDASRPLEQVRRQIEARLQAFIGQ